jgi:thiamine-phosphate pyrophosphorylase
MARRNKFSRNKAARPDKVEPRPAPRLYLVTPPIAEVEAFDLVGALAAGDVAAVLLRLADADERTLINRAKAVAAIVQDRNAALLLDGRHELVARTGADGAHLTGLAEFTEAIARLKPDWIAGAGNLTTRHDSMTAAELGADYVMFGEPDAAGERPSFEAIEERVAWWAEVFEAPCVGYAGNAEEVAPLVKAGADFIALGGWIWRGDTVAAIAEAAQYMRLPETAT